MIKSIKSISCLALAFVMIAVALLAPSGSAFASSSTVSEQSIDTQIMVDTVKKYLKLNKDGTIGLSKKIPEDIRTTYKTDDLLIYFDYLNNRVKSGEITINKDFSISSSLISAKDHGENRIEEHWWGWTRYADSEESEDIALDLYSAAAGATMAAGLSALGFPPGVIGGTVAAGYWSLLATRILRNDEGHGTIITVTYLAVFNVSPQE
ncbi:hypothetical protein VQL36_02805 [Chengkuizengella sp. SCS-71B]|uniref:hypothetical protein n=1 Tax=Chengkuizengella sp. SCS-71B TaxID=3115290 RepID=UPI0032C246C8